ncbi:actin-like protein [Phytophthora infestans T30-4]|uniref:Actin-like protein n=3 Tax=Phytophthora TaxID=4783 RepID=D0MTM6_PHYIT|nr:actin-like protein [Phytophthora infestans T30-4]EEY61323.1 actin-like protein [Phytophthora infestans T30-4]KAF4133084.1 actin [Phytophthora infestans]KAF4138490.1 actin [Phytophthora infestans]|eukprot:XP_002908240.1 actin-like protein [Phytophthora infestans T30-4]
MASAATREVLGNQPLVIDNGSGLMKAGFAGGETPQVVFPSFVGTTKHTRMMPGGAYEGGDVFVGNRVQYHRGLFKIQYAMEHGVVTDWNSMHRVWQHVYSKDMLNVQSEDHPVLLTEAPLNPVANRQRAGEVFFEAFNVPSLFVSPQAVLSLYASGRTTGVVLDVGDGVAHVVPVYEGFTLPHAITRMDIAGRDVTRHLQLLLRRAGYNFLTSAEREVVREIKEKLCYVAFNPTKEEQLEAEKSALAVKDMITKSKSTTTSGDDTSAYYLPDGTLLNIGPEKFRAPEVLFRPEIIGSEARGVHECLVQAIMKSDMDLRKTLFSQIILSGGSTLFPGFGDRLLAEVRKKAPKDIKIRISAPPTRIYSTWIGGSILASLATFKNMWITKSEYEEYGASILHRKNL